MEHRLALGAFSHSYEQLLVTRLALGEVTATAGPAIASLTGDSFPASERGRVYAYILGREIAGEAVGYIGGGSVTGAISWRPAHGARAPQLLPGALWRTVPSRCAAATAGSSGG